MRPAAIGYLRRDVSGAQQEWDEIQIRSIARRLGYALAKTIALSPNAVGHMQHVITAVGNCSAEAVIVPSGAHFDGEQIPAELIAVADVITASPEETFARWIIPPDAPADMGSR